LNHVLAHARDHKQDHVADHVAEVHPASLALLVSEVYSYPIKANDVSWVTACVDGAKVLNTLLNKGYAGELSFSRQATLRFGNAGAIELSVGNQPAARLGQPGEIRAIKATPNGYQLIAAPATLNCSLY